MRQDEPFFVDFPISSKAFCIKDFGGPPLLNFPVVVCF